MTIMRSILCAAALLGLLGSADAAGLTEPALHVPASPDGHRRVALTFDACSGQTDMRILNALVDNRIPATIFVTARWLKRNGPALAVLLAHPDLFEIENHGLNHVPAVDENTRIYGIKAAGSPEAVRAEVQGGAAAIEKATGRAPKWFRGATAKYTATSIAEIHRLGQQVAGYSVNGDGGSLLGARTVERNFANARDGDVVIAHINQPKHAAGEGVVKGLLALKAKGAEFVRLETLPGDRLPPPPGS